MTVWNVDKNAEAKTMVITAEFKTSITNVWQLWADPRLLERWWGPPGFPATFEHHNLTPGGTITYFMSGPDGGDRFDGTWNVIEVDAPTRLVVEDAIVEDDGTPSDGNSDDSHGDRHRSGGRYDAHDPHHAFRLARRDGASDRHGCGRRNEGVHVPDRRSARRGRRLETADVSAGGTRDFVLEGKNWEMQGSSETRADAECRAQKERTGR